MAVFAHLKDSFDLSRRVHGMMHIQRERERQDPKRQTATVQYVLKHSYMKQ